MHPFSFAKDKDGFLWVKVEGKEDLFIAIPSAENAKEDYLLFSEEALRKAILQKTSSGQKLKKTLALDFQDGCKLFYKDFF